MPAMMVLIVSLMVALSGSRSVAHEPGNLSGPPGERLGTVTFPLSCQTAMQQPFERAVALLHSFWYLEALQAFTAVTQADPDCAMGYWGIAMSHWYQGSDIHVMLALYSGFGQVIVANEILDRADMVGECLGKRQRTAHQT